MSNLVYLAIGSNIGNRIETINKAYKLLQLQGKISKTSFLYQSSPMYYTEQGQFINGALEYRTDLTAFECMHYFQSIEQKLNRDYKIDKGPRTIDLDIIFYNQEVIESQSLIVPHQNLLERDFVITPLLDIDPDLWHPLYNQKLKQIQNIQQSNDISRIMMINKKNKEIVYEIDNYKAYKMGIVNMTPDSFYDNQQDQNIDKLLEYSDYFDLIDIGGQSTRPNYQAITLEQEILRLKAIMQSKVTENNIVSLDSSNYQVCQHFQDQFDIINDISGSNQSDDMLKFAAETLKPMVITHNINGNSNQILNNNEQNSTQNVIKYFQNKIKQCQQHQIPKWNLIFDIGLGFNKCIQTNLNLINSYEQIQNSLQNLPSLIGFSNKKSLGKIFNSDMQLGNNVMSTISFMNRVNFLRIHDKQIGKTIDSLNKYYRK